jgi:MFS family permease
MFLPMVVMAWTCAERPGLFISIVVLYTAFGAIVAPAWSSLMSDHIAQNKRGSYFGWRNRTLGYITVAAAFAGGIMLNVMKKVNVFHGFLLLFAAAFLCRMVSVYFLTRMYEPWLEHSREHQFTLLDFIGRMRTSNFGRFVSFVSLMTFAVFLASPFFSLFMLRELRFSYFQFTVVTVSSTLAVYFAMQRWGNHADRVGNLRIVKFTAPLLGVIPLLWVINRHPVFLIMAQIFSGFMWAGFNLCAANFVLDAVTPEKRTRCVSFFNLFNGVAVCAGSLAGGYLIRWLPPLFGFKLLTLFLISGVLRMAAAILLPRSLKEVRDVEEIKDKELLLSVTGIRPWKRQI